MTENDSLACFEIFNRGLSKTFDFQAFPGGQEGYTWQHSNVFSLGSRRQNFGRESFLAFCSEFERHTLQDRLSRALNRAHFYYFLFRVHKTVASFVQKVGLIWLKDGISVIQDAKVIVNHCDKPEDDVMCTGKENKAGLKLVRMKTDVATHTSKLLLRKKMNIGI